MPAAFSVAAFATADFTVPAAVAPAFFAVSPAFFAADDAAAPALSAAWRTVGSAFWAASFTAVTALSATFWSTGDALSANSRSAGLTRSANASMASAALLTATFAFASAFCVRGSYAASWMALLALPTPYPTAYAALDAACLSLSEMPTMLPPCRRCAVGVCSRYPLEVYMPSGQRPGAPVYHVRTVSKHINRFNGDSAPLSARRPRPDSTTQLRVIQLKTILFEM